MLCYAKELNIGNGVINKNVTTIAWRLRMPVEEVQEAIDQMLKLRILIYNNNNLQFRNWDKRQYSESYKRVQKYRAKRYSNAKCNADVTGIETKLKRTETETDNRNRKCNAPPNPPKSLNGSVARYILGREPTKAEEDLAAQLEKGIFWKDLHALKANSIERDEPMRVVENLAYKALAQAIENNSLNLEKVGIQASKLPREELVKRIKIAYPYEEVHPSEELCVPKVGQVAVWTLVKYLEDKAI
jgi:hypothetical protein